MKKHLSLSDLIEAIERPVYYIVLIFYFGITLATEITDLRWPWLESVKIVLFPAVLLVVFRYFDRLVRTPPELKEFGDELGSAVSEAVGKNKLGITLELLACTTAKYFVIIKDEGIRIDQMRIFMPTEAALRENPLLRRDVCTALLHERTRAIQNWRALQNAGRIIHLEFFDLSFVPMFHILLINRRTAVFGLFNPSPSGASFGTMTKFLAKSGAGSALVHDCAELLTTLELCPGARA